jgi:hypothetical protein
MYQRCRLGLPSAAERAHAVKPKAAAKHGNNNYKASAAPPSCEDLRAIRDVMAATFATFTPPEERAAKSNEAPLQVRLNSEQLIRLLDEYICVLYCKHTDTCCCNIFCSLGIPSRYGQAAVAVIMMLTAQGGDEHLWIIQGTFREHSGNIQ